MKPKDQAAQTMVVNINLTRGPVILLTLALLATAFLGYLALSREQAAASTPPAPLAAAPSMRQYYLTPTKVPGGEALTPCAAGYHMASLWEILDTSNLKYNTSLGATRDDSGQGPPSGIAGWVRTGYAGHTEEAPGRSNCNNWTSSDILDQGTWAMVPYDWSSAQDIHMWDVNDFACSIYANVWCVED